MKAGDWVEVVKSKWPGDLLKGHRGTVVVASLPRHHNYASVYFPEYLGYIEVSHQALRVMGGLRPELYVKTEDGRVLHIIEERAPDGPHRFDALRHAAESLRLFYERHGIAQRYFIAHPMGTTMEYEQC